MSRSTRSTRQHPGFIHSQLPVTTRKPKTKMADNGGVADNFPPHDEEGGNPPAQMDQLVELLQKLLTLNKNTEAPVVANIAKVSMPKPDSFWGTKKDTRHPRSFLLEFNSWAECAFPQDVTAKTRLFPACLKDRAALWHFTEVRGKPMAENWDDLQTAFLLEFAQVDPAKLTETYMFREQSETETVSDYAYQMHNLMSGSDLTEQLKVMAFIRGLRKGIAMQVYAKVPKTFKEAEKVAKEAELLIKCTTSDTNTVAAAIQSMADKFSKHMTPQKDDKTLPQAVANINEFQLPQQAQQPYENRGRQRGRGNGNNGKSRGRGRGGGGNQASNDPQFEEFLRWKSTQRRSAQSHKDKHSYQQKQEPQQSSNDSTQQYSNPPQQYYGQPPQEYGNIPAAWRRIQSPGGRNYFQEENSRPRSRSPFQRRPPTPHSSHNGQGN